MKEINITLPANFLQAMRRQSWDNLQKIKLEMEKYRTRYPGYLQDKVYLQQCQNQLNEWMDVHNRIDVALNEIPQQNGNA